MALPRAFGLQVQALLNGQPLPPPSASLEKAWEDAKREAVKSEYSFKPGLVRVALCSDVLGAELPPLTLRSTPCPQNYYATGSPAS